MNRTLLIIVALFAAFAVWDSVPRAPQAAAQSPVPSPNAAQASGSVPAAAYAAPVSLSISPRYIIQGDPALVTVNGVSDASSVASLTFNGTKLVPFATDGKVEALVGVDLHLEPKAYPVKLMLADGRAAEAELLVTKRPLVEAPLDIPQTLGGNSTSSVETLVSTLVEEGKIVNAIKTSQAKLWNGSFTYPVAPPITVTDPYGYSRATGGTDTEIAHKGTDFRAATGTPVFAINAGRVAYTGFLRNYGNVVAIDHGTGVLSLYMHLSKILVSEGQAVAKGEKVALSGDTGYVLGPHLHLTVRIGGVSIDPLKFYGLLGPK